MSKKEVAEKKEQLPVDISMFEPDIGAGMEGTEAESFAIPFLKVLQKMSPEVDEADGAHIDGAKPGMLYENVTGRLLDGKDTGVTIIPCAYRRTFIKWGSDASGESFKGEFSSEEAATMRADGHIKQVDNRLYIPLEDGSVSEKKCERVSDTRNHFILILDEENGGWQEAVMSLTSTQIKKSKMLMSALAAVKLQGKNGLFTPPTFANRVRMNTVPESNDNGSWFGAKFSLDGQVSDPNLYAAAKDFHDKVRKGDVGVKRETGADDDKGEGGGF